MKADYFQLLSDSVAYMEQHIKSRLRGDAVAAAAHYSYPHFARIFSDVVGMSPLTYIARRRLTQAAKDLIETDREIADIALDAGFESQQTFTRALTSEFGMPPLKYRSRGIPGGMTLPEYDDPPWLEEHLTLPRKGGFHGFRLWMAIREV